MTEFEKELLALLEKHNADVTTCSCCGLTLEDDQGSDIPMYRESLKDELKIKRRNDANS